MAQLAEVPDQKQLRAAFEDKVRRGIFRRGVARFLPEALVEERLQDAICQTWEAYVRYANRGKILADAILVHFCRLRAVDPNRWFVPCSGTQPLKDALDFRNYASGRVEILRFDGIALHAEDNEDLPREGDVELHGMINEFVVSPSRKMNSAIDLENWLEELHDSDRNLLAARACGFTLEETAADAGVCISTVHARTRLLGAELAARAGVDVTGTRRKRRAAVGGDGVGDGGGDGV